MKKRGYTLQNQIRDATNAYAEEVGDQLAEHGFAYRHDVLMTDQGMRFVFEASINGKWPTESLPEKWANVLPERKPVTLPSLDKNDEKS